MTDRGPDLRNFRVRHRLDLDSDDFEKDFRQLAVAEVRKLGFITTGVVKM